MQQLSVIGQKFANEVGGLKCGGFNGAERDNPKPPGGSALNDHTLLFLTPGLSALLRRIWS